MADRLGTPLVVGVAGHRILTEVGRIRDGIARAFDRIARAYPGRPLSVVSALAEGADRLVAEEGLARGATLHVVLPLPAEDYLCDFDTEQSKEQFGQLLHRAAAVETLPPYPTRDMAYEAVGERVVDMCDVVIAVWDGQGAQGQGGTGGVVAYSDARRKPLLIVRAGNRMPGTNQPTSLGTEQGKLIVRVLPE